MKGQRKSDIMIDSNGEMKKEGKSQIKYNNWEINKKKESLK